MMLLDQHERSAIGLYAVLARDWTDFIDMVRREPPEVLSILCLMLITPNNGHTPLTEEINRFGADIVIDLMRAKGIPVPEIPATGKTKMAEISKSTFDDLIGEPIVESPHGSNILPFVRRTAPKV